MYRLLTMMAMLALLIPAAATAADSLDSRHFEFSYTVTVDDIPAGADTAFAWVPVAASDLHQDILAMEVTGGYPYKLVRDAQYDNTFLKVDLISARGGSAEFSVVYEVVRHEVDALDALASPAPDPALLARYLQPDAMVPITGVVADEAQQAAGHIDGRLEQARALYGHVVETMRYDKSGEGWGRGDAVYACDVREGNCTDFHSLFIAEARSLGIPARFLMGVPLPMDGSTEGGIGGYHCWAEFYLEGTGWVPVDASEAAKAPGRTDELFAGLDASRVQFTTGRDIALPESAAGVVNFIIYPHCEVDGVEHPASKAFSFRDM